MNLAQKKKNVRSKYWKTKADAEWGKLIHKGDECAIGINCAGALQAHHLISRANVATRHDPSNGILLCAKHHIYSNTISAHGAPMEFAQWLKINRPDSWDWVTENKFKTGEKADYKQAYEELVSILNG